jgi:hypothetical protein
MAFTPIDEEEIIDEPVAEEVKPRFVPIEDDEFFGIGGGEEPEPVTTPEAIEPAGAPKSRFTPISDEEFFGIEAPIDPIPVTGEEGFLRQAADVPLKIGESINTSLRALTDLFGADNAVSQNLTQNAEWYRSLLSAQALEDEQEVGRILQEAENEGVLDQLGAGLEAFSVAPVDFVASGVGSLAVFAATGVAGRAAALAGAARAGLTGAQAAQFVQRGVQATQLATGAGMGAGIVKGEIYQSVKDEMLAQGKTEEEARQIAMEAQSYGGKNLDQILIGAGLGTIDAFTGAEKIIGKVLTKGGLAPNASRVGNILKNGIAEGAPEFIQAAQEKFASNLALQREGVDVSLTSGVFSQGALEGLVGVGMGAGAGAIEPRTQPATKEEALAAASETQDVARRNKDVAPETASLVEGQAESVIQENVETPDQRVARLQEEATAAAGIELEEEGVGVEPPVPVTPPVAPTPEGAVAPVEPTAAATPTEPVAPTPTEQPPAAERPAVAPETLNPRGKQAVKILTSIGVDEDTASYVASRYQDEAGEMGAEEWRDFVRTKFEENGGVIPAQMRYSEDPEYYQMAFNVGLEEATTLADNGRFQNEQMAQAELQQNKQWRRKDEQVTETQRGIAQAQPEGQAVPLPAREVPPSPAIEGRRVPLAAPEAEAVTPNLEPLRRVARAEQAPEDVPSLLDAGLVEVYKDQPVLTEAGIAQLPEAERPRLTPEARKIQIDTGSNEVVAEAIAKGLRIGVDQVGTGVRMPAGWTLVEDIYVPPAPQEVAPTPEVITTEPPQPATPELQEYQTRVKSNVAQIPTPEYGTTQEQRTESLDAVKQNLFQKYSPVLNELGFVVRSVGKDETLPDGGRIDSNVVATPDGGVEITFGNNEIFKFSSIQPDGEIAKSGIAQIFDEEIIHAIHIKQILQDWDGTGNAEDFIIDRVGQRFNGVLNELGRDRFVEAFGSMMRGYYRQDISNAEMIRFITSNPINVLNGYTEVVRQLVEMQTRGEISETVIQRVIGGIKEFFNEIIKSINSLVASPEYNRSSLKTEVDAVAKAFQSVIDKSAEQTKRIAIQSTVSRQIEAEAVPTFSEGSPEASTLSNMKASMAKVDAASEAKGPTTYKISEIASIWMDQGGDTRQLQDLISENTNLTPANAKKVANAIAKQYDIQQSIKTAFIETQTGLSVEALPEGVTLPKEVDPDRPRPVMQRLFDVFMGVRVPPVKITVNEKTALNQQIRLKAAATREAKKAQQETANEVVEIIKAMEIRGPVRPKQAQALAKRAAKVIWTSEKSIESFTDYAAKVVENTNYDADVQAARDAQKRAKALSTQKKVALSPQREVLSDISKIAVNRIEDPRMFAEMVNYYLGGFKAIISPDYVVVPDSEMEGYLSSVKDEEIQSQRELDRTVNLRLAEKYGVDPEEVNEVLAAFDVIKEIEANENREAIDNLLTEKAIETRDGLRAYDSTPLRQDQRKVVDAMAKVDPAALDAEERQRFIRIANNVIFNNQTNGAEYFMSVANGQQNARIAAQDSEMISRNKAWVNLLPTFGSISAEKTMRGWALELQSVSDTFRNAFGLKSMAKIYKAMGMLDLNSSFTQANNTVDQIQEEMAGFHNKLEKDYGAASRNQDGLLAEGIAGFLIQRVPKKDEADSIAQRRDLIRQDISNRRQSGEIDRVAMADRIEAILNQIDGTSTQDILDKLKETYRPNYDSLIWYKDTLLPKYKDFLKNFDESFNDQANNYDNPDYLPIAFNSAGPSLAITKEEEQVFYDQVSLRPKQSANTIKRVDYSTLPKDRTTGTPKEIEFNLRRSAFNSLSDQINKAYTSGAWQQIASFMKTPESTQVFGGQANKDFFVDRLNRLRLSRMRRGAMSRGAFEKAADAVGVISRKLGTGIALGGVYQWIKQPPDQLVTAWGSGARGEVLARNIAPSNQKAARTLLNKFSIGRRGDASAGYKYINQMEGHQNRLERYFSESKWDQAKEQAGKIADVWMIGLKKSDFIAASAAWMTYYETELNKRNIQITDWNKESELIDGDNERQEAAAYAEQMTDIYQGSSDPTQMAVFAQSGKSGAENLLKAMFVPFNSFAVQQRMRLYSDVRDVLSGDKRSRGGLAGTIGGLILFHATKRYVLPVISGSAIGVLYSLMGVDVEEPDEEKQKEQASKNFRQFLADASSNLLVGGMPQVIESQLIKSFNYAAYLTAMQLEDESVMGDDGELISFDKYQKERSPLYRYQTYGGAMSLGMLEIGFDQAKQVALSTKMVASEEEMETFTPEEKRLLYFSALSDWLYLMRLNDTDFARLVQKARRDMIKSAEEREKELARIRAGR